MFKITKRLTEQVQLEQEYAEAAEKRGGVEGLAKRDYHIARASAFLDATRLAFIEETDNAQS